MVRDGPIIDSQGKRHRFSFPSPPLPLCLYGHHRESLFRYFLAHGSQHLPFFLLLNLRFTTQGTGENGALSLAGNGESRARGKMIVTARGTGRREQHAITGGSLQTPSLLDQCGGAQLGFRRRLASTLWCVPDVEPYPFRKNPENVAAGDVSPPTLAGARYSFFIHLEEELLCIEVALSS